MNTNGVKSFFKVIVIVLVVAVLGVGAFFVHKYSGAFTTNLKTFTVSVCGVDTIQNTSNVSIDTGKVYVFNVKYPLGFPKGETRAKYKATIERGNTLKNLDYTVDGEKYSTDNLLDITQAFDVVFYDDYFTVFVPNDFSLQVLCSKLYIKKTVVAPNVDLYKTDCFNLKITSYNGEAVIVVGFHLSKGGIKIE